MCGPQRAAIKCDLFALNSTFKFCLQKHYKAWKVSNLIKSGIKCRLQLKSVVTLFEMIVIAVIKIDRYEHRGEKRDDSGGIIKC